MFLKYIDSQKDGKDEASHKHPLKDSLSLVIILWSKVVVSIPDQKLSHHEKHEPLNNDD